MLSEGIMVVLGTLILIWPVPLINIFSSDPELTAIADTYIRIAAVGYMMLSFNMVLQNCISGAGDTLPPMVISLIIVWAIQIPLGWLLSKSSLGVFGVRWAVVAGAALNMIAFTTYFKMGRWKRKRIY
jgi:Na+-driven multidrug efflux pump